ncbi:MAG: putative metalloprotease CJM1_0395 family protein [Nibricoccus sp.]
MAFGLTGISSTAYDPYRNFQFTPKDRSDAGISEADAVTDENFPGQYEATDDTAQTAAAKEAAASELQSTDREVRSHEAAHIAAGGSHITSGATYSYRTGPDGKQYAVGGEVGIDISPVPGNPQATITKMMMVRAAALAPANPSPQDLAVAAAAAQMEANARAELTAQNQARISETQPIGKSAASVYRARVGRVGRHVNTAA